MLVCRIIPNEKDRWSTQHIIHAGGGIDPAGEIAQESWEIDRTMMINIVGPEYNTCDFLQEIILFICRAIGADHTQGFPPAGIPDLYEAPGDS